MGKLISLLFLLSLTSHALVPSNFLLNDTLILEKFFNIRRIENFNFLNNQSIDKFDLIKDDPLGRISPQFQVTSYYYYRVKFWFAIYTQYTSYATVIHDKKRLNIIYEVVDFTELKDSFINIFSKSSIQNKITLSRVKEIKAALVDLAKNKNKSKEAKKILDLFKQRAISIPRNRKKKKAFFLDLADNIRIQTGQKDNINQGLKNISPFRKTITSYFKIFNAPIELLSIPFLESSFNTKAKSKVGANGVWQFMPYIGKHFVKIDKDQDGRINPILSSLAALHLLKQNFKITKRWDLSVTAYNSGTKHILKARRKLKKSKMTLEDMLRHYDHPHVGFASKNFYSEFIALVYALTYREKFYDLDFKDELKYKGNIKTYVNICPFKPATIFKQLKAKSPDMHYLNLHFYKKAKKKTMKKGNLVFSDLTLNAKKYFEVKGNNLKKYYPKNYYKYIRKRRCR